MMQDRTKAALIPKEGGVSEVKVRGKGRKTVAEGRKAATKWTDEVEALFLAGLAERGIVGDGCKAANVVRRTVQYRLKRDVKFAAAYEDAIAEANDKLVAALWERGVEGVDRTFIRGGQTIKERYHDTPAANLLMRARFPQFFGRLEVTGAGGKDLVIRVVE